jgi:hypothetical protein
VVGRGVVVDMCCAINVPIDDKNRGKDGEGVEGKLAGQVNCLRQGVAAECSCSFLIRGRKQRRRNDCVPIWTVRGLCKH